MGTTTRIDALHIACQTIHMSHKDSQTFSRAIVRLDLEPSQRLSETLKLFLNAERQLDPRENITIRSLGGFSVSLYGNSSLVRPFPYYLESHGEPTVESRIRDFENTSLSQLSDTSIPLASFLKTEYNPQRTTRLMMKVLPLESQRPLFDKFNQFLENHTDTEDPGEFVAFKIPRTHLNLAKGAIKFAQAELDELLRPHDKIGGVSDYRQGRISSHDDDVYLSLKPKLAITHAPRLVVDNRYDRPSTA